jgi:hypothetical protein
MNHTRRAIGCGCVLAVCLVSLNLSRVAGDDVVARPAIHREAGSPVRFGPLTTAEYQATRAGAARLAGYRYPFNYPYYRYKPRHYPNWQAGRYHFGYPRPGQYPFGVGPYGPNRWNYGGYTGNGFDGRVYGDSAWLYGGANPFTYGFGSSSFGPLPRGYATPSLGWMGNSYMPGIGYYPCHTWGYVYGPPGGYGFYADVPTVDLGGPDYSGFDYEDLAGGLRVPFVDSNVRNYGSAMYGTGNIVPLGGFYQGW